jgi:hypothetical protein
MLLLAVALAWKVFSGDQGADVPTPVRVVPVDGLQRLEATPAPPDAPAETEPESIEAPGKRAPPEAKRHPDKSPRRIERRGRFTIEHFADYDQ